MSYLSFEKVASLSIPFANLPERLGQRGWSIMGDGYDLPLLSADSDPQCSAGYHWHKNLGALETSAESCKLCALVQAGVEAWKKKRDIALSKSSHELFNEFEYHPVPVGNELLLTRRFAGPGFLVFVRSERWKTSAYLLTGVAFSVEASHEKSETITARPIDCDSGSSRSLEVVSELLKRCYDCHEQCSQGATRLPSRILDIGKSGETIKLIDTHGEQTGVYASLSYCWGDVANFTTTQQSIHARRLGIHLSELPKTFLDAIEICRHLDIHYLWIDSLCICQDDAEDWTRESARMIEIYSNAHLVIAANQTTDSAHGIFHKRSAVPSCVVDVPGYATHVHAQLIINQDEYDVTDRGFPNEPLSKRAWALQERVLARRVLHYNTTRIYFECDRGVVGEDGSFNDARYGALSTFRSNMAEMETTFEDDLRSWLQLICQYGQRNLSKYTDTMPAISGLAALFGARLQANYVAGVWDKAFVAGLGWQCWRRRDQQPAKNYIGPSWSWASYPGMAAMGRIPSKIKPIARVVDWHVELKSQINPYGELNDAWLKIQGPVAALLPVGNIAERAQDYVREIPLPTHIPRPLVRTFYTGDRDAGYHRLTLDSYEMALSEKWKDLKPQVILLYETIEGSEDSEEDTCTYYFGLVIGKDDTKQEADAMKRIGYFFMRAEVGKSIEDDQTNRRTVTLF